MNRPIRILYTIPNFITAGSGRAMLNIIERLDRERFDPAVAVLKKGGALDAAVDSLGIPFLEYPFTVEAIPYSGFPRRAWRAAQAFKPYAFDIWHSFHYSADYSEPVIARLAGARAWVFTKKNMNWHRNAWHLRTRFASGIAAQNTDMLTSFFSRKTYARKTMLIPRGVESTRFTPGRDMPRPSGSASKARVNIGCLAHLVPVKGHPTLMDAMSRITGADLHIAGKPLDAEYVQALHEQCAHLGIADRVHFLGDVKDTVSFLRSMDVMVLPTWAKWRMEGCPVSLLEAMSTGLPCVATDIPGARDIIRSGIDGFLVPPENEIALSDILQRLVVDPALRSSLGSAARERVLDQYTIEREVHQHEQFYERVLRSRSIRATT